MGRRSVIEALLKIGATQEGAETIAGLLRESGLSTRDARDWVGHQDFAYPHPQPPQDYGGVSVVLVAGSRFCFSQGREDIVVDGARSIAAASEAERTIAQLFGGNIPDVRKLTGGDPKRADVVREIALLMQQRLGNRRRVYCAASAMAGGDGDRIRDRITKGEEHAVLNELQAGSLDLNALADSRDVDPTW
jgi:hypothetical protein